MTSLRAVERHVRSLRDIRAIMNSMKSLAYMETHKLSEVVPAQRAVTEQIEIAAADLLTHYPELLPAGTPPQHIWIVLGTERGFCGNLNQKLLERLDEVSPPDEATPARALAVGRKLHSAMPEARRGLVAELEGAGVAEEVPAVLNGIVEVLETLRGKHGPATVSAICFDRREKLGVRDLLPPPFRNPRSGGGAPSSRPILNLPPEQLLLDLADQYLFSSLFEVLFESLLTENERRVAHLGDAVRHLDQQTGSLTRHANALRQEQITEEIEVLLLSSGPAR
jgi:F-type H+-transporting ATPase subunit gamma